ncbi:MAG: hypothetical protein JW969_19155 [Spirochaetales bacterium]|nr:hypothetical protein [Spirochaetales bacterium]
MEEKAPMDPEFVKDTVRKAMDESDVNGINPALRIIRELEAGAGDEDVLKDLIYPETLLFFRYISENYPTQCVLAGLNPRDEIRLRTKAIDIREVWSQTNESHQWIKKAEKAIAKGDLVLAQSCFVNAVKIWKEIPKLEQKSFSTMMILKTLAVDRTLYCRWLKDSGKYKKALTEYKVTGRFFKKLTVNYPHRKDEYAKYLSGYASALHLSGDNRKSLKYYCKAESLWEKLMKKSVNDNTAIELALCYNNHVLVLAHVTPEVGEEHFRLLKRAYYCLTSVKRKTTESRLFLASTLHKWALFLFEYCDQNPGLNAGQLGKRKQEAGIILLEAEDHLAEITDCRDRDYYMTYIAILELILNECDIEKDGKRKELEEKLAKLKKEWQKY